MSPAPVRRGLASVALVAAGAVTLTACSAPTEPTASSAALQRLRLDAQAVAGAEASGDLATARRRLSQLRAELDAARGNLAPGQIQRIQAAIALVAADLAPHQRRSSAPISTARKANASSRNVNPARAVREDLHREPVTIRTSRTPQPVYTPAPHYQPTRPPSHARPPGPPKHHSPDRKPAPKPKPKPKPAHHGPAPHGPGGGAKPDHGPGDHKPKPHGPADN